MSKLHIVLRDRSNKTGPAKFLVESNGVFDEEGDDENYDALDNTFKDFVAKVKRLSVNVTDKIAKDKKNHDIYVGWWGSQDTFHIEPEFFKTIGKLNLSVMWDIND